ncbi:DUF1835 domain-containing protein [Neobacillus sp. PS2-9]|uniref:DUF1835 domain-containing protein n=1 Tax=Neobacillus sp. PS2-9 TaxID=3070676 RepID=UPI0027E0673B|nr:DUF1835 domain-containing protein [Neobacillus sp. PS2-9]WML57720.1 DUF1835 domain-containing protein [Neobacillus sp. PS2-9]
MKARNTFPYIYFFEEPNVVYVYKIQGDDYITTAELSHQGEWETYEITDSFEGFNHEENSPLEGRGYFISQSHVNFMVGKINELIRKQRKGAYSLEKDGPVHLVSSASTAGALKVGLERPKTVIPFQDYFSIGPVWKLDKKSGQAYRHEWMNDNINLEQDEYELENNFTKALLEIEDIPEGVPIYIWTANNGNEQTGLRFFLHLMRNKTNQVFVLNTTELFEQWMGAKDERLYSSILNPNVLRFLFEKTQAANPLIREERMILKKEWEILVQTKEVLRLWKNGKVTSVPDDYFDALIIEVINELHKKQKKKDFIRTGRVIGEALHRMEEIVGDFYLEYRIRHLIYNGVLEIKGVPRSMRHYSVKLPD